jgi:hypothetical protein
MLEFRCPKCGAPPHKHGKGGAEKCQERTVASDCEGLICECDSEDEPCSGEDDHGTSFANPCRNANCYHCGWGGTIPAKPKGLEAWEKKALAAGWTPPEARKKELGLVF